VIKLKNDELESKIDKAIEEENFEELLKLLKKRSESLKAINDKNKLQKLKIRDEERIKILKKKMERLKNEAMTLKRARNEYKKLLELLKKGEDIGRA